MTQNYEEIVRQSIVILVVMSVAFPIGGIGIGSAQQRVSISPDFPDRPTAGERTSVSVSIETPDVTPFGSISTDAEINLYVDGSLVNSRSITIGDGEVISSDVGHTFQEGGSKNVRIEVVGSLRNLEFSPSVSGTVDVQPPEIFVDGKPELSRVDLRSSTEVDDSVGVDAEVTAPEFGETDSAQLSASLLVDGEQVSEKSPTDINPEGERSISFNPTFESTGQKNVTLKMTLLLTLAEQTRKLSVSKSTSIDVYENVSGAMFNTPDSLQEEVTRYRENLSEEALSDLPPERRNRIKIVSQFVQNRTNSSVLATENRIYIVLGRQEMDIERVSVRGFVLDKNLTDDVTFGVIAATEISDVQPEPVNIQDVTTNSEEYQLDSVQIESHYRRISLRYDPDGAGFAETKLNVGVLTNDPITGSDLFSNLGSRTEAIANNSQDESTTLRPIDSARSPYLRTVSFSTEEQFWIDAPAEVRGLILRSDSPAVNFLQRYYPSQVEYLKDERQILYVTDTNLSPQNVGDIQEINSRADSLNQEVVQTEVNLAEGVISTQENIERYSPGGPEILQIPANPPVPINVVVDTAIHTGIGWNAQPRSRDDTIFIIGASSTKIDQSLAEQQTEITSQANSDVVSLLKNKTGRYRLTGEVVSTSQVAESLPEGAVFLIYDIEQISETIEFKDPSQGLIQTDFGTLRSKITEQLDTKKTAISPTTKTGSVGQVPGDSTSRVTLSGIRSGSVSAQQLTFNTTTAVQDVSVSVSQPATTPDSIPSPPPPTGVLDVLNISTSIADSRIQQSKIQLQVYNAAVPADRELIVYRYDGNSWVPVSTNTVRTTETTTTVASTVSDFSYFAVGHTDTNPNTGEDETDTSSPTITAVDDFVQVGGTAEVSYILNNVSDQSSMELTTTDINQNLRINESASNFAGGNSEDGGERIIYSQPSQTVNPTIVYDVSDAIALPAIIGSESTLNVTVALLNENSTVTDTDTAIVRVQSNTPSTPGEVTPLTSDNPSPSENRGAFAGVKPYTTADDVLGGVGNGAVIFQDEEDIVFKHAIGNEIPPSRLNRIAGRDAGGTLEIPIPRDQKRGEYSNGAGFSVTVQEPRVTELEIQNNTERDVSGGILEPDQNNASVLVEYNYEEAENIELTVENENGVDVTQEALDAGEVNDKNADSATPSGTAPDGSVRFELSPRNLDEGEYTFSVAGVEDLGSGTATQSVTATITADQASAVDITRTVSSDEAPPGEVVTLRTEITGASGSVSTSTSYEPQLSSATVQSVTVDGASANPIVAEATVTGSTVTVGDVSTDTTVTITEKLTVSEELTVTHQITGDVTAGETTTEVDPVSVTVTDADVDTPTPVLTVTDATAQPGTSQTTTAEIRATRLPTGIQEYELRVSLRNASVADFEGVTPGVVSGQAFQIQSRSTAGGRVTFRATDLAQTLEPGATNRTLATVTYTDTTTGTTPIELGVTTLTDDQGTSVRQAAVVTDGRLTVEPVTSPFPGGEELPGVGSGQAPTDPDDDGKFEDINGDGEKTFDDAIALAFANPSQLTEKQVEAVDFDADGDVDFGDAVALAFE